MTASQVSRWDNHLIGVALAAGVEPRGAILARCWQGSWVWNLMVFNVHRPRAFVGAGDSGALLGWGLTSAGHQLGTFARSDVRVTVSLAPVLVRARVSVQGESAVHSVKIQFNGPVACRRFLMWIDACAEARDGE